MKITEIPSAWRSKLRVAFYKNAFFHCESNAREAGCRIVLHQFPKKELPYAEDMGHMAQGFSLRGYCITYGRNVQGTHNLYLKDYTIARDQLRAALDSEGPGALQLPTQPAEWVVCTHYRLSEEEKLGGYCVFDMTFSEFGLDPALAAPTQATQQALLEQSIATREALLAKLLQKQQQKLHPPLVLVPPSPSVG